MNDKDRLIENLHPEEKEAFLKGYNDCKNGMKNKGPFSVVQPALRPPIGFEGMYRDGWRKASEEVVVEADTKAHHGYALGFITLGGIVMFWSLIAGAVFVLVGIVKYFSKGPIE